MAYRLMVLVMAAVLAIPPLSCLAQARGKPQTEAFPKSLIDSTIPELVRRFGEPIEAIPMLDTGGKLYIFEMPHHDYCIVETQVGGDIVSAVVQHSAGR